MSEHKKILKSASLISGCTLISRILGLIRDIVTAKLFGTGMVADAFFVAFTFPNLFRRLFGEGALNSAFVPVFSEYISHDKKKAGFYMANITLSILFIILSSVVLLAIGITAIIPCFFSISEKLQLTFHLLQIMSPYMIFICLAALFMGILHSFKHFLIPAIAPVILNIFWIGAIIYICPKFGETLSVKIYGLAIAVFLSGIIQLLIHVPFAIKKGLKIKFQFDLKNSGVKKVFKLIIPVIAASTLTQSNVLVDTIFAYILGPGMQSSLWYSQRILHFPLGVFGIAMSAAILPHLSHLAAQKQIHKIMHTLSFAIRIIFMIIIPCTTLLLILNLPIIKLFFERGNFDAISSANTAFALFFYSIGLIGFAGNRITTQAFYAVQNTKTPIKIALFCMILNIILNLILMWPLKQGGLALASSISGIVQFGLLIYCLKDKIGIMEFKPIIICFGKVCLISMIMALVCIFSYQYIEHMAFFPAKKFAMVFVPLGLSTLTVAGLTSLLHLDDIKIFLKGGYV